MSNYTAVEGLINLINALNNGAADGTGISPLVKFSQHLAGNPPPELVQYEISLQNNIFGDYPTSKDLAPSIVFCVVFFIIGIIHLTIFLINTSRGHYFYISLIWVIYCIMRIIGFALRAVWSGNIILVATGLTSEVLLIIPSIVIISVNLILAQRLFTWRHPVGGSRKLFWSFMINTYVVVLITIAITIAGSFVPYLHYLSYGSYDKWKKVVMATSVLVVLYTLTAIILIGLSYWAPTAKDEKLYTYQPWWIESFHPFYFVKPHAAQEAEETFMKRNHNHRHAIRVIAATHHHYNMVEGLTNQRGDLTHNWSILLLVISSLFLFIGALGRCIACFQARQQRYQSQVCNNVFMYICWGLFEVIINIMYIVGRVDLRFYRPDVLPQKVRSIITAEQTYNPSDVEDDEEDIGIQSRDYDDEYYEEEDKSHISPMSEPEEPSGHEDWNFIDTDAKDIKSESSSARPTQPPYPVYKKDKTESEEFHF